MLQLAASKLREPTPSMLTPKSGLVGCMVSTDKADRNQVESRNVKTSGNSSILVSAIFYSSVLCYAVQHELRYVRGHFPV